MKNTSLFNNYALKKWTSLSSDGNVCSLFSIKNKLNISQKLDVLMVWMLYSLTLYITGID